MLGEWGVTLPDKSPPRRMHAAPAWRRRFHSGMRDIMSLLPGVVIELLYKLLDELDVDKMGDLLARAKFVLLMHLFPGLALEMLDSAGLQGAMYTMLATPMTSQAITCNRFVALHTDSNDKGMAQLTWHRAGRLSWGFGWAGRLPA